MYKKYFKMLLKKQKRDLKDINKFIKETEEKAKHECEKNIIKKLYSDMLLTKLIIGQLEELIIQLELEEEIENGEVPF